jgi:hypothetical protein
VPSSTTYTNITEKKNNYTGVPIVVFRLSIVLDIVAETPKSAKIINAFILNVNNLFLLVHYVLLKHFHFSYPYEFVLLNANIPIPKVLYKQQKLVGPHLNLF